MTDIPHLAIPLTLGPGGQLAVNEQDTLDDVAQCVQVLLETTAGSRIEEPSYGVPDLTFRTSLTLADVEAAIDEWEPRATVELAEIPHEVTGKDVVAIVTAAVSLA